MDYDEMTDHIVKFEVGALYYLPTYGQRTLALYLGFQKFPNVRRAHIFYVCSKNRNRRITNSRAIRMAHSLHKLITKVETDVTATER